MAFQKWLPSGAVPNRRDPSSQPANKTPPSISANSSNRDKTGWEALITRN